MKKGKTNKQKGTSQETESRKDRCVGTLTDAVQAVRVDCNFLFAPPYNELYHFYKMRNKPQTQFLRCLSHTKTPARIPGTVSG